MATLLSAMSARLLAGTRTGTSLLLSGVSKFSSIPALIPLASLTESGLAGSNIMVNVTGLSIFWASSCNIFMATNKSALSVAAIAGWDSARKKARTYIVRRQRINGDFICLGGFFIIS